ncbi:uncharacterized protein BDZ99DRAFT_471324 [Mytilinidion resinicola]|uniref:Uncharacterized protein n=1 Tax=Mytilinidion resinicola TaxID=574789 RepID=A0A6A6Z4N5_9PEZI|nr:uncharacterized protein BDZ99DRAFT_471324 [Mytilinidion resinicola]KAF2816036.1 hypothetical protein BDZ99DRAFT_471324 [Mytilinidion resinicola]
MESNALQNPSKPTPPKCPTLIQIPLATQPAAPVAPPSDSSVRSFDSSSRTFGTSLTGISLISVSSVASAIPSSKSALTSVSASSSLLNPMLAHTRRPPHTLPIPSYKRDCNTYLKHNPLHHASEHAAPRRPRHHAPRRRSGEQFEPGEGLQARVRVEGEQGGEGQFGEGARGDGETVEEGVVAEFVG